MTRASDGTRRLPWKQAADRVHGAGGEYERLDWFLCLKKLPEEK